MIYLFQYKQLLKQVLKIQKKIKLFVKALMTTTHKVKKKNRPIKIMPMVHKFNFNKLSNNWLGQAQQRLDKLQFVDVTLETLRPLGVLHQHRLGGEGGGGDNLREDQSNIDADPTGQISVLWN